MGRQLTEKRQTFYLEVEIMAVSDCAKGPAWIEKVALNRQ
ncbi:hypothetical protein K3495_g6449 [Podosphaera aphanis]|nr:hypothetical protein K3495_g6449 [Podosphaera aphanis]